MASSCVDSLINSIESLFFNIQLTFRHNQLDALILLLTFFVRLVSLKIWFVRHQRTIET